jgi:hypothetical protein
MKKKMKIYHLQNFSAIENSENQTLISDYKWICIESIIFVIIFAVIFLIGLFSNSVVILVYLFNKRFKRNINYLFANLSITAILVLIICVPIAITDLINDGNWKFGLYYCN